MADCLGLLMIVRKTEVSLIQRAVIERLHCSTCISLKSLNHSRKNYMYLFLMLRICMAQKPSLIPRPSQLLHAENWQYNNTCIIMRNVAGQNSFDMATNSTKPPPSPPDARYILALFLGERTLCTLLNVHIHVHVHVHVYVHMYLQQQLMLALFPQPLIPHSLDCLGTPAWLGLKWY